MAIKLNGGNLTLSKNTPFGGSTPQSLDFWIYFDTVPNNATLMVHSKGSNHDKELFIENKKLKLYVFNAGAFHLVGVNPILEKAWNHIAYVFTGSKVILYLNGVIDAQVNLTSSFPYSTVDMTTGSLHATFDDIRYWTRALSQTEIRDIMKGNKINPTGLQHHFVYDGTTGNTIKDLMGGNSISIGGSASWTEGVKLTVLKFIMQNLSNSKYYTIKNNALVELLNRDNETIIENGIDEGTTVNIAEHVKTLGANFKIISYSSLNDAKPLVEKKLLHTSRKLATSPEVLLLGVETIDSIVANSTSSPLTAISFDNGSSWLSYDNGNWFTVENAHQGMSIATLNSIPSEALTQIRGEANYIKFQHSFGNDDSISSFKMYVSFKGTNGILDTAYYSFDYNGGQLDVTLKKKGNYSIVYTDVEV